MNYGLHQVCMTQNTPGYLGIRLSHRTAENSTLRKLLALKTMGDTCATTRKEKKKVAPRKTTLRKSHL